MKRCIRCDIPLQVRPCPNPLCREFHGQSAGDLCMWCHRQAPLERQLSSLSLGDDVLSWDRLRQTVGAP